MPGSLQSWSEGLSSDLAFLCSSVRLLMWAAAAATMNLEAAFDTLAKMFECQQLASLSLAHFLHGVAVFDSAFQRESWFLRQTTKSMEPPSDDATGILPPALFRYIGDKDF